MRHGQFLMNSVFYNPAITGTEKYLDIKTGYTHAWTGFEGAPTGAYLAFSKGLEKGGIVKKEPEEAITSVPSRGRGNAKTTTEMREVAPDTIKGDGNFHLGIGGNAFVESAGPVSLSGLSVVTAGHLHVYGQWRLSIGIGLELMHYRLNPEGIILSNPQDVAFTSNTVSMALPGMNAGWSLYSERFFISGTFQQLISNRIQISPTNPFISGQQSHFYNKAGMKLNLTEDIEAVPLLGVSWLANGPAALDLGAQIEYKNTFSGGLIYRVDGFLSAMLGMRLFDQLRLWYAYDIPTSGISTYGAGSHNIVMGWRFSKENETERRYFW